MRISFCTVHITRSQQRTVLTIFPLICQTIIISECCLSEKGIHLFLQMSPHLPQSTHHFHHPSLLRYFIPGIKSCSINHFHPRLPFPPSGLTTSFLARHCGVRLAVDFTYVNRYSVSDAFPISDIHDIIQCIGNASCTSLFDATSRYWQTEVVDEDRWKTGFICDDRLFEWNRTSCVVD